MLISSETLLLSHLPVKAIIEHEAEHGIPPHRIILGGFSQVRISSCHHLRTVPCTHNLTLLSPCLRVERCLCTPPWPPSINWLVSWLSVAGYHFTRRSHRYGHKLLFFLPQFLISHNCLHPSAVLALSHFRVAALTCGNCEKSLLGSTVVAMLYFLVG